MRKARLELRWLMLRADVTSFRQVVRALRIRNENSAYVAILRDSQSGEAGRYRRRILTYLRRRMAQGAASLTFDFERARGRVH